MTIPQEFHKLFIGTEAIFLDINKDYMHIIGRLFHEGDIDSWKWVGQTYSRDRIIEVICLSHELDNKDKNFFSLVYKIPREKIKWCRYEYPE